jgi:RsiW-degrading membrane proteinase PrsW (M82 family)
MVQGAGVVQGADATRSQLIPVLTKWEDISKKAQLGPAIFCIAAFFSMVTFGSTAMIPVPILNEGKYGNPAHWFGDYIDPQYWIYTSNFLIMVAAFLTMASLYFIYRLVGKNKSWWVLLGSLAFTAYFLWLFQVRHDFGWLYDFFHEELAGGEPDEKGSFFHLFMQHFLGTGFFEELVKALPVLLLVYLGRFMSPALRAKIGVEEPLDGILVGAAAGGGFAIMETLCQYVPQVLVSKWLLMGRLLHNVPDSALSSLKGEQIWVLIKDGAGLLGTAPGLPSLLIRSIDLSFGHMAYSGYFGYFIGLSVLKPQQRWKILGIGLVSASLPHALWDSVASLDIAPLQAAVALLSYGVLAAAILKAREISPNRNVLQPSVIFGAVGSSPVAPRAPMVIHAANQPASPEYSAALESPRPELSGAGNRLRVGAKFLVIVPGLRLMEHQVPGLVAQGPGGLVAEVTRNPNDPSLLGLTNMSTTAWEVVSGSGARRQIATGQTIKLAPGTKIDFGPTDGEVG